MPMPSTEIPELSTENLVTLNHLSSLLHLLHHRNKNQHRRSIWYRHFSLFRRHLTNTIQDYHQLHEKPTTHLLRTRKPATDATTKTRISHRLTLWQDVLVPKWQRAFSQIVAEGRFAVVGVVLLAVLGQVCSVMGVVEGYEELGQREMERVIEGFGREFLAENQAEREDGGFGSGEDDLGVVVAREEEGVMPGAIEEADVKAPTLGADRMNEIGTAHNNTTSQSFKPPARKKKRKANAIDDLFGALD